MQAPPIIQRNYTELVTQTETLATALSGWRPRADGAPDAGQALIQLFAHFAELVVERINRAPEKNYLAFLNLIGTPMAPPQPARAPLTFMLAANSPIDAFVPAGTQVAAPPLNDDEEEVIFETDRDLVVTRAQLQAVYVSDTESDTYQDCTLQATGQISAGADAPFAVFQADQPTPHQLYLACDPLLTQPGLKTVTLLLTSPDSWQWLNWPIHWEYWDGASWQTAKATAEVKDGVWRVTLTALPPLPVSTINAISAGWLRAVLALRLPPGETGALPDAVASGPNSNPQPIQGPFAPFSDSATRFFYVSADESFAYAGARLQLQVTLATPGTASGLTLSWAYKSDGDWIELGQSSVTATVLGNNNFALRDETQAFTKNGALSFHVPMAWPRQLQRTRTGRWLRVQITNGQYKTLPVINTLTVSYDWELPRLRQITVQPPVTALAWAPSLAFVNNSLLDVSKDFYPLGEQPRFNDTFYVACPPALVQPNARLSLKITLTNPAGSTTTAVTPVYTAGNPQLAWEMWDGAGWKKIMEPANDPTAALTKNGEIALTLPTTVAPTVVNGEEEVWLRARLVGGNYGSTAQFDLTKPLLDKEGRITGYPFVSATLAPPLIQTLTWTAASMGGVPLSACLSNNDFVYTDQLVALGTVNGFQPFTPTADSEPALYLGFDQAFANRPVSLYLQVEPPRPEEVAAEQLTALTPANQAQVTWEYCNAAGWQSLGAWDETATFSSRGLLSFVGPADAVTRPRFGQALHWLRARWVRGEFPLSPRLRRVLLNTTWATQTVTVEREILGTGNGEPNQHLRTAQAPVQPGQQLFVRELETPPPDERQALFAQEGDDAIVVTQDAAGQPDEIWVRWHAVGDFYHSGPRDRHYTIDALTGEIGFGDGRLGLLPPQGQNNIRIRYRTGGGAGGNRPAHTLIELKSSVPAIERVTNYEAASGGAPQTDVEELQARGPRALRHRDCAVTAQDLSDLARAASTEVARVAVVTPTFNPLDENLWIKDPQAPATALTADPAVAAGRMGVLIVPKGAESRPTPSLGLLRQVQRYLQARCPATAALWVAGPEWVAVVVTATIVPTTLAEADAIGARVRAVLDHFLHPLTGGPTGEGWSFGRNPHDSDLFAVLEATPGLDHVRSLSVTRTPETADPERQVRLEKLFTRPLTAAPAPTDRPEDLRWLARALVYSGQHSITVALETR